MDLYFISTIMLKISYILQGEKGHGLEAFSGLPG